MVDGRPVKLETFCVGPDNKLWMCCAGTAVDRGLIMVYSGEGEMLHSFPLKFIPQALNFSPEAELMINSGTSKWQAIQAKDGELDLVTVDEGVQGFGATIEFQKDETAKFSFFYGDANAPMGGTYVYKRIALEACGQDCKGACGDERIEKKIQPTK